MLSKNYEAIDLHVASFQTESTRILQVMGSGGSGGKIPFDSISTALARPGVRSKMSKPRTRRRATATESTIIGESEQRIF